MKVEDIYEFYKFPETSEEGEKEIDIEFEEVDSDFDDYLKNPYRFVDEIDIDPDIVVDLVKDAQIITTLPWHKMLAYIEDYFDELNGTYHIASDGYVLHTFKISQSDEF